MGTIQDKAIQWCKRQEEQLNQFKKYFLKGDAEKVNQIIKDLLEGDEKMIEGRIARC
jgi:hypothetical protein